MNKGDFIAELLLIKKLSIADRERLLKLAAKEFNNNTIELNKIWKEIEILRKNKKENNTELTILDDSTIINDDFGSIEELFGESEVIESGRKEPRIQKEQKNNLNNYYHPSDLYSFLFNFNQNQVLKSTCHEIDANDMEVILDYCETESYDFKTHLNKIVTAFEEHEKKYFCPPTIKALIRGYITGKDYNNNELKFGWSSDKIKTNWSHSEIAKWSNSHNIPPNSATEIFKNKKINAATCEGFTSNLFGKRVQTFRELVLHFKSLFHIRFDNSLQSIINKLNIKYEESGIIEFDWVNANFANNIELFTDVDKLIQAYSKIIDLIITQHLNNSIPRVKLSFFQKGSNIYFSIHHLNNTYNKSIQDTIERGIGQTYSNLISKQINGLCNLYLRADFEQDGIAKINLWNGDERKVNKIGLENFEGGVEHIFEFCKIK